MTILRLMPWHVRAVAIWSALMGTAWLALSSAEQLGQLEPGPAWAAGILMGLGSILVMVSRAAPNPAAASRVTWPKRGRQCVYIVTRRDGLTKIGYSGNFPARLSGLEAATGVDLYPLAFGLFGSEDEARSVEARMHDIFDARRRHGEWFRLSWLGAYRAIRRLHRIERRASAHRHRTRRPALVRHLWRLP